MTIDNKFLYLAIILSPLVSSIIVGFFGWLIGKKVSHSLAILGVLISTIGSYIVLYRVQFEGLYFNGILYNWLTVGSQSFSVGLLVDKLSSVMLAVVTSVSLMVHIYTIGYMAEEEGYQRFFSYISLFTFMMLMLVLSNNFVQLFFGWEGVGLVSYLLIGFYIKRESAIFANLKAFLINRIGDFGFLLGIGLILAYTGSLDYGVVFSHMSNFTHAIMPGTSWNLITVICLLLFMGAMGKSAQFPLHVWLPDSMEGPTPISALIHAATMVTAGIFMVARLSPIYNMSHTALAVIIYAGGINCLFLGVLGIVQNDIKRVVAYSTLSQLGYMAVALGCGAYSVAIFHLMTHAFFKGLLFLAAGSVIIAMHHEQDMRKMGGLGKYMPITYITMLIGSLALAGIPPFAGFFSKDMILESAELVHKLGLPGGGFAVFTVYTSVIVTAIYSFRLIFMTFHGEERFRHVDNHHGQDDHGHHAVEPEESPWVVTLPLILMAIPSALVGWFAASDFVSNKILSGSVANAGWFVTNMQEEIVPLKMVLEGFTHIPVYLALAGILIAWLFHKNPKWSDKLIKAIKPLYVILMRNYYMDDLYINLFAPIGRAFGRFLWTLGDMFLIDGLIVNGSAKIVDWYSKILRKLQSGYVNTYATFMILGIIILLTFCTRLIFA
ncbi:MAG: NADH-quinone oxidoreductase subunit [Burkholderiales bacterium]|jgi:NADH-quinone oxidoreductase subunit L|nr:NADH-quinone oxidoreductase subunit [Burkholderiales bacterium]